MIKIVIAKEDSGIEVEGSLREVLQELAMFAETSKDNKLLGTFVEAINFFRVELAVHEANGIDIYEKIEMFAEVIGSYNGVEE